MCSCVVFQILHSLGLGAGGSRRLSLPFLQEGCHQRVQGETLSVLNMRCDKNKKNSITPTHTHPDPQQLCYMKPFFFRLKRLD